MVQGQKSLISFINALNSLFEQGIKPTFLAGDDEKGFCSQEMIFLNSNGITWQLVERKFDGCIFTI